MKLVQCISLAIDVLKGLHILYYKINIFGVFETVCRIKYKIFKDPIMMLKFLKHFLQLDSKIAQFKRTPKRDQRKTDNAAFFHSYCFFNRLLSFEDWMRGKTFFWQIWMFIYSLYCGKGSCVNDVKAINIPYINGGINGFVTTVVVP